MRVIDVSVLAEQRTWDGTDEEPFKKCDRPLRRLPVQNSAAYPGLITSLISASRWSNGMNADFIAFTVSHCRSAHPYPNASTRPAISAVIEVSLISRLSVL